MQTNAFKALYERERERAKPTTLKQKKAAIKAYQLSKRKFWWAELGNGAWAGPFPTEQTSRAWAYAHCGSHDKGSNATYNAYINPTSAERALAWSQSWHIVDNAINGGGENNPIEIDGDIVQTPEDKPCNQQRELERKQPFGLDPIRLDGLFVSKK